MTDVQLYLAIGVPVVLNATMLLFLQASMSKRFDDFRQSTNQRIDDLRDTLRAELLRVEGVLDARLKHIEEERTR